MNAKTRTANTRERPEHPLGLYQGDKNAQSTTAVSEEAKVTYGLRTASWCTRTTKTVQRNHSGISYQGFPCGSTFPIHNPFQNSELPTQMLICCSVISAVSRYLVYWRADAVVFAPRGVGQAEAACHGALSEVDEPVVVGEVARDVLRLAEM